ncbi:MAG: 3-mercaptopyruvate sulfurtransferase [Myxococcota bacterium]
MARSDAFVTPAWLAQHLQDDDIRIVDGSWYLPSQNRDARQEYEAAHLPGAIFFDISALSRPDTDLPHMLPEPSAFAQAVQAMGIGDEHRVVVYDDGLFSAARVWWTFRVFGHNNVRILDGGRSAWCAAGYPIESESPAIVPCSFTLRFIADLVVDLDQVHQTSAQIVDARGKGRFEGKAPEPRAGVRAGHIPGSRNLPYTELVRNGRLLEDDALAAAFEDAGVDIDREIYTTCGSGVTAAILSLALFVLGRQAPVYDGSWTEWGGRDDMPVST